MATLEFVKGYNGSLVPADDFCLETMKRWKLGAIIRGKFTAERNGKHHRKCFVLIQTMFENQDRYTEFKEFYEALKIPAGLYDIKHDLHGVAYKMPWSLRYEDCDQIRFEKAYQKLITFAIQDGQFFEGKSPAECENFVNQILGGFA